MVKIIQGDPGVGKTALMTKFAIDHMFGAAAMSAVQSCKAVVKQLNKTGFNLTAPRRHLVFADYQILGRRDGVRGCLAYEVDGFSIGLPNDFHPTVFLPPYSFVCLDEAQKYYDSRRSGTFRLPAFVSRFYETHRHNYLNFVLTCQRPTLIDLNIRGIAEQFIAVDGLKHYYDRWGQLVKSVWSCTEFDSTDSAEAYAKSKVADGNGKKTEYVFEGNIFSCYNSFGFFALHYRDRYDEDFTLDPGVTSGWSLAQIEAFNERHDYEVPKTFFSEQGGKK